MGVMIESEEETASGLNPKIEEQARQKDLIDANLERALFIKFSKWLFGVTIFVVPLITGIAVLAVQGVQFLWTKDLEDVKKRSIDANYEIMRLQARSENAASLAAASAADSKARLERLNNDIDSSAALPLIKDVTKLTETIATTPSFILAVSESLRRAGGTSKSFPEAGEFRLGDNVVTRTTEFPICTISKIDISRPVLDRGASCELVQQGDFWRVNVSTNAFCRVTCFK
jgi:hypothetical protein